MTDLAQFVIDHTDRGECQCGRCADKGNAPDPTNHTADLIFFKVCAKNTPDAATLRDLIRNHTSSFGDSVDPLDGQEHGYIELGGWLGDQGVALQFMGLTTLLGLTELLTPRTFKMPEEMVQHMAGAGYVTVKGRVR